LYNKPKSYNNKWSIENHKYLAGVRAWNPKKKNKKPNPPTPPRVRNSISNLQLHTYFIIASVVLVTRT
jgi:hypothetical protein